MNIWLLGGLWAAYYFIHSLFAANTVKRFYERFAPGIYRYYRFIFSFFATVNFGLLFYLQLLQPQGVLLIPYRFSPVLGGVLLIAGVVVIFLSMRNYSVRDFLGLDEIQDKTGTDEDEELVTSGMNKVVRHPLYTGILIMLVGFFLLQSSLSNLVFCVVSLVYLFIGIWLEERKLIGKFGEDYIEYRKRTSMIIPYLL